MDKVLYSTTPRVLGFYEYVIVGGGREMTELKRIPEPKRRLLVMKNMSMLLTQIPQEYDSLRDIRFKHVQKLNFQIIFGGGGRGRGRPGGGRGGRGRGFHPHHIEERFRHMLATGNHLARFAKKQYKGFPIMQTMASQLLQVVQVYREQLDHTFLFGGQDKTLEQHFTDCAKDLNHAEKTQFQRMVAPHMKKLEYLMNNTINCQTFEKAINHMLDVLLEQDIQTQTQAMYSKLFLCVLSQVARTSYASCLDKIQHKFYLLNERI